MPQSKRSAPANDPAGSHALLSPQPPYKDQELSAAAVALRARRDRYEAPACLSLEEAGDLVVRLLQLMFPHFGGGCTQGTDLESRIFDLSDRLTPLVDDLLSYGAAPGPASGLVHAFLTELPSLSDLCHEDALTLLENDPAAISLDEVILSYPGFMAVATYRLAHALLKLGVPLLPRLMTEYAHQKTGIDIHPKATIGKRFFIDHGTGVVIGGTAVIGNSVKLYQGVTIGALRVDRKDRNAKRHPTLEDNVVVYASATILGGDTVVGARSVIGGNVWLTHSVPPGSRIMFKGEQASSMDSDD